MDRPPVERNECTGIDVGERAERTGAAAALQIAGLLRERDRAAQTLRVDAVRGVVQGAPHRLAQLCERRGQHGGRDRRSIGGALLLYRERHQRELAEEAWREKVEQAGPALERRLQLLARPHRLTAAQGRPAALRVHRRDVLVQAGLPRHQLGAFRPADRIVDVAREARGDAPIKDRARLQHAITGAQRELGALLEETEATGRSFEVQHVPESALEDQYRTAGAPLPKTFATLMLGYAAGDAIPIEETAARYDLLRSVREYARDVTAQGRNVLGAG